MKVEYIKQIYKLLTIILVLFSLSANDRIAYATIDKSIELTTEESEFIESLGKVKMCVDPDWYPYEKITENGEYYGIAADLIALISNRTGIEFEIVQTQDWAHSLTYVREGNGETLAFLNETEDRKKWLIFTDSYYSDPNVMITREEHDFISDLSRLSDEKIVLPEGTSIEEHIRKEYPNLEMIIVKSEEEAIDYVSTKKADLTIRSLTMAAYVIKSEGLFNLKIAGQLPELTNYFKIGINKELPLLKQILDKGIRTIKPEEIQQIVNKHISIKVQSGMDYKLIIRILISFGFIMGLVLFWNRRLRKLSDRVSASEKLYKSILKASPDSILVLNSEGEILMASKSSAKMLNAENESVIIGRNIRTFVDEKEYKKIDENIKKIISKVRKGTSEYIGVKIDGQNFIMEANSDFIDDENEDMTRIVSIIRDITERRNLEKSLKESEENAYKLVKELEIKNKALSETTIRDSLTGIRNRYYFDQRIIEEANVADRYQKSLSLIFFDLDKFKLVNDTYGHEIGDEVLICLAGKINSMMRKTDIFARWGGEEFVVLMPETTIAGAVEAAEKIRNAAEHINHYQAGIVTISIGVSERLKDETIVSWFNRTDKALYKAKSEGRNRVIAADESNNNLY